MPFYNSLPLIGKHLKSEIRKDQFSPEEQKKLQHEYRESLGLGHDTVFNSDAFEKHSEARLTDFHGFSTTKGPGGINIHEKLMVNTPQAATVQQAIQTALKPTDSFIKAKADYTESAATFKDLVQQIPGKYKPQDLIGAMTELKDNARKAILAQQKFEKEALEAQFAPGSDLIPHLNHSLNLNSQNDIDAVKTNLIADLETSQKKQLADFDKSTSDSFTALHKAAASEMNQLLFIANLHKNNKEMRKKIEELAAANREKSGLPPEQTTINFNLADNTASLSGIRIEDLGTIKSITGKDIVQKPDGSFELTMGWKILDPKYYLDPRQNPEADMRLLAQAVRASGYEKITMNVNFDNPEVVMERAKQAYSAAIASGFKAEDITIKVNGKEMKAADIYKDAPAVLNELNTISAAVRKELEDIKPTTGPALKLSEIKAEMERLRPKKPEADDANPNQAPPINVI